MTTPTDIAKTLFNVLEQQTTYPVAFPNGEFSPDFPYLRAWVIPTPTQAYGLSKTSIFSGILQIDCVVGRGAGHLAATRIVDAVLKIFPRGTKLYTENGYKVEFNTEGYIGPSQQEPDRYFIPVSFNYKAIGDE